MMAPRRYLGKSKVVAMLASCGVMVGLCAILQARQLEQLKLSLA
jgi:hypothetical protein